MTTHRYRLRWTRSLVAVAGKLLSLVQQAEAQAVGQHITALRNAKTKSAADLVERSRQHDKFAKDQSARMLVIEEQTTQSWLRLQAKRREQAALNVAATLEIQKFGGK